MALYSPPMDTSPKLYDVVMAHLREKRIPQRQVAIESGVPFSTVAKIAQERVKEPSVHTIQRLYDYFMAKSAADESDRRHGGRRSTIDRRDAEQLHHVHGCAKQEVGVPGNKEAA